MVLASLQAWLWRLRCILLSYLFTYTGWIYRPKSLKTLVWSLAVKFVGGSRNHGIQGYVEALPSLPLPDLQSTLRRYLISVKPLLTDEQYATTCDVVQRFQKEEGPKLQQRLKMKCCSTRNWLEDIWLKLAYMRSRTPLPVFSNIYCVGNKARPTTVRRYRAAMLLHQSMVFMEMYQKNKLPCFKTMKMIPMCSSGYRYAFGGHRVPGVEEDSLRMTEKPDHVVILCNGHYYQASIYAADGSLVTPHEWADRLADIERESVNNKGGVNVAALTGQDRDTWGRQYARLRGNETNSASLEAIETAALMVILDDSEPETDTEIALCCFTGNGANRFFDKTYEMIICANGIVGTNIEHAPTDATVWARIWEYCLHHEQYTADGDLPPTDKPERKLSSVLQLAWDLDDFSEEIETARQSNLTLFQTVDKCVMNSPFGKGEMKRLRVSPDGFTQMVIQLAYYRLHQKFSLTYESASTRMFYHGRTETIRPVSHDSIEFCKSIDDPSVSREHVAKLVKSAIKTQTERKVDAVVGHGIDRHLIGLYAMSMLDSSTPPEIFRDPAWSSLRYDLSTSQTPTKLADFWTPEKCCLGGGFGPVTKTGYGVSYIFNGEDTIYYFISCLKTCPENNSEKFTNQLLLAMEDIRNLLKSVA
ncbi:carnitine O-palmitoyltransferase 1, liver isoform-like isoform X2 [Sycon ciliatum]|uniref:carnitine O-palmitoyltransferase 1, liver isoform-like isoform X2 n=1 Tax=Sycon ciliatum TaxID=27933 RepID=UPI0031F6717A